MDALEQKDVVSGGELREIARRRSLREERDDPAEVSGQAVAHDACTEIRRRGSDDGAIGEGHHMDHHRHGIVAVERGERFGSQITRESVFGAVAEPRDQVRDGPSGRIVRSRDQERVVRQVGHLAVAVAREGDAGVGRDRSVELGDDERLVGRTKRTLSRRERYGNSDAPGRFDESPRRIRRGLGRTCLA
jgi:hypothetical protein